MEMIQVAFHPCAHRARSLRAVRIFRGSSASGQGLRRLPRSGPTFDYRRDVPLHAIATRLESWSGGGRESNPRKVPIAIYRTRFRGDTDAGALAPMDRQL